MKNRYVIVEEKTTLTPEEKLVYAGFQSMTGMNKYELNVYDRKTFGLGTVQGGNFQGYSDYPDMAGTIKNAGKYDLIEQDRIGRSLSRS